LLAFFQLKYRCNFAGVDTCFFSFFVDSMCVTQTVDIPADRRLHLDFEVPIDIPIGKAQIELKVISFANKQNKPALKNTGCNAGYSADNCLTPHTDALLNILSNLDDVNIDEIREERLAKHL
jgi:hypothetical protein